MRALRDVNGLFSFCTQDRHRHHRRRRQRRTKVEGAAGRYAGQHPTFADALSPERCQAAASRHRRRADRARRHDGHACRTSSTADAATPVPSGALGAVGRDCDSPRQVFLQLLAGGAPLQITRDTVDHQCPRWSPDSSSILYFSPAVSGTVQGSIWEIPALGGVPRRVLNSVGCADVSTDGRLALFRLAKDAIQLVTAPPDNSRFDVVAQFAPATYYLYPRWSPDGRWIAFERGDNIRFDIFVAPATGGEPHQVTHENNMISGFVWLPDSTGIIYSSSRGGTTPYLPMLGLWQVALRDGSVRQVTSGETSYTSPDISRSGAI